MTQVHIVVGTVTGTAAEVAQALAERLAQSGIHTTVNLDFKKDSWRPDETLLVCTANTGMGDLPANIRPFFNHLESDFPAIAGRRYGLINLGDSSYPNFAEAGRTLDDALADLGALRLGEPLLLDAIYVDNHVFEALAWLEDWTKLL